jgi:predicted house-cleaning noncanonical NTP pyrophosphatase (MazG superfamily)
MREKLIRDKIPELAAVRGEVLDVRVASEEEMSGLLESKLVEEALELRGAKTQAEKEDELADVIEVVLAIVRSRGHIGVYSLGIEKHQQNGGFAKRLVLRVDEEEKP